MEKMTNIKREKTVNIHEFYCDECNEYLGCSEEYDDGYYYKRGDYCEKVLIHDDRKSHYYSINKCLCDKCKKKITDSLIKMLTDFGFVPEKD